MKANARAPAAIATLMLRPLGIEVDKAMGRAAVLRCLRQVSGSHAAMLSDRDDALCKEKKAREIRRKVLEELLEVPALELPAYAWQFSEHAEAFVYRGGLLRDARDAAVADYHAVWPRRIQGGIDCEKAYDDELAATDNVDMWDVVDSYCVICGNRCAGRGGRKTLNGYFIKTCENNEPATEEDKAKWVDSIHVCRICFEPYKEQIERYCDIDAATLTCGCVFTI